ncbi:MAG: LysM peptidoglycan-binding domain-containing protein [Gemmatimonadaceae bacterium]|nr:LysM peptidoglycan-binding domain-containing protein [Gemmatimonadaceae bacterium]
MRSAEQAHISAVDHSASRLLLARVVMAILATLALLLTWHPTVIRAQDPPPVSTAQSAGEQTTPPKQPAAKPSARKDTASTTHLVKAGETLWSIASRYYGDGHQWRAVARRNGIALSSDTALRIGTRLVIPSRRAVVASASVSPAPKDTATPKVAMTPAAPALPAPVLTGPVVSGRPVGALTAQTSGKANVAPTTSKRATAAEQSAVRDPRTALAAVPRDTAAARDSASMTPRIQMRPQVKSEHLLTVTPVRIGLVGAADLRAARPAGELPTVFLLRLPDADIAAAAAKAVMLHAEAAPRHGEYAAAPFPVAAARWTQAGRLVRRLDDAGGAMPEAKRMQLADEVEITPPAGTVLSVGDRLVAVKDGGPLTPGVHVGIPTGILQVTQVRPGTSVHAYVRSVTGIIEQGEALFPIEGAAAAVEQHAERVTGTDVETSVTWIDAGEVLPTLQSYVLLAAGQAQGVKAGEQFALVRRSATGGEERIADVRVVRVGATGSAAIVIRQSLPEIASGVKARRITRLP